MIKFISSHKKLKLLTLQETTDCCPCPLNSVIAFQNNSTHWIWFLNTYFTAVHGLVNWRPYVRGLHVNLWMDFQGSDSLIFTVNYFTILLTDDDMCYDSGQTGLVYNPVEEFWICCYFPKNIILFNYLNCPCTLPVGSHIINTVLSYQ